MTNGVAADIVLKVLSIGLLVLLVLLLVAAVVLGNVCAPFVAAHVLHTSFGSQRSETIAVGACLFMATVAAGVLLVKNFGWALRAVDNFAMVKLNTDYNPELSRKLTEGMTWLLLRWNGAVTLVCLGAALLLWCKKIFHRVRVPAGFQPVQTNVPLEEAAFRAGPSKSDGTDVNASRMLQ